jgi:Icc-related predicted phosphoesterase
MKFRIISDLHVDINNKYYSKFKFDPEAYYLIAGDVSGSRFKTAKFMNYYSDKGLTNCAFIEGNHMGYDRDWESTDHTKEACYAHLHQEFPLTSNISFMDNDFKEVGDDIIIVGCTLYTNYLAYDNRELGMKLGETYLNDFRYVLTYAHDGEERLITALDYEDRFNKSIQFIEEMCNSNPNHKIIVMTHHAPSKRSLSPEYVDDLLSSSYASKLDDFIMAHSNIKLWCHGHVHRPFNYKIGECDVICNPFGYYNENSMKLTQYIGEVYEL